MTTERRAYSRVKTNIQAWIRRLPSPSSPQLFNEATSISTDEGTPIFKGANLPEPVIDFLTGLDNKLDRIIGLLSRDQLQVDFPIKAEVINLSGAGALFHTDEPLTVEDHVETVFVLNTLPLRMAGAVGKIMHHSVQDHSTPTNANEKQMSQAWALEFSRIRERDLDLIVRFVLQEERRHIRSKKWD